MEYLFNAHSIGNYSARAYTGLDARWSYGQQRKFEALDFCYYILRVQRVDGKDDMVKGIVS